MRKKNVLIAVLLVFLVIAFLVIFNLVSKGEINQGNNQISEKAKGIMILIEYKDIDGLKNFATEMEERNIKGLLTVTPEFVTANCSDIKKVMGQGIEIVPSNVKEAFWGISYEEQKETIIAMKKEVEACTNVPVRMISSRYMASDMVTLQVADELGIPYILARGTTDTKATVYEVEDYNTKILSVSNIPIATFKYGSLCDYSFFVRSGTPGDMRAELDRALEPLTDKEKVRYGSNHKVTPVSQTWIGGALKPWNDMWLNFWDESTDKVEWASLDEFMADSDWVLPLWQVPINRNAPYTPEKLKPLTSFEDVEKVENMCK